MQVLPQILAGVALLMSYWKTARVYFPGKVQKAMTFYKHVAHPYHFCCGGWATICEKLEVQLGHFPTFPGPKIQKISKFHLHLLVFSSFPHSLINHIKIKLPCHVSNFFLGAKPGSTLRAEAPQGPLPKKHHLQADKLKRILNRYPHYNKVKCQLHSKWKSALLKWKFSNGCLRMIF